VFREQANVGAAVQWGGRHHWTMPCGLQSLGVPRRPISFLADRVRLLRSTGPVGRIVRESLAILATCSD
jgi:hypothetical protein